MTTATETTKDTTYNGWTNYATWRVNLEIVDDYIDSISEDTTAGYLDPFDTVIDLADSLQSMVEELIDPEGADTLAHQYANAFISDVNWYEIAMTHAHDNPQLVDPVCTKCGDQLERHEVNHGTGYCDGCEDYTAES